MQRSSLLAHMTSLDRLAAAVEAQLPVLLFLSVTRCVTWHTAKRMMAPFSSAFVRRQCARATSALRALRATAFVALGTALVWDGPPPADVCVPDRRPRAQGLACAVALFAILSSSTPTVLAIALATLLSVGALSALAATLALGTAIAGATRGAWSAQTNTRSACLVGYLVVFVACIAAHLATCGADHGGVLALGALGTRACASATVACARRVTHALRPHS